MPNSNSSKKRLRQTTVRTQRNRDHRSELRTAIKQVRIATTRDDALKALSSAEATIDRACGKKLIHPNNANRQKSRLHKVVAKLS